MSGRPGDGVGKARLDVDEMGIYASRGVVGAKRPAADAGVHPVKRRRGGGYTPTTPDTRAAWEQLLNNVSALLGDDEQSALHDIAEELLRVLKDPSARDAQKRKEVEELLELKVNEGFFATLQGLARKLGDYSLGEDEMDDADEDDGRERIYAVGDEAQGGGDDDDEDEDEDDDDDDDDDDGAAIEQKNKGDRTQAASSGLDAKEIDAYWLQRKLPKLSEAEEPAETQRRAELLWELMANLDGVNAQRLEAEMQRSVFKYHAGATAFMKLCSQNRAKIVFCTRMARAKGDELEAIQAELRAKDYGPAILDELQTEASRAEDDAQFRRQAAARREEGRETAEALAKIEAQMADVPELEDLTLDEESLMRMKVKCPPGTQSFKQKGFEEVHIPPYKRREHGPGDVRPVEQMPKFTHPAFSKIRALNPVQSQCYNCAFERSDNMLLCAPTGAGKTNVAMLTIMHELGECVDEDGEVDPDRLREMKVVYIAPMKALVQEVVTTFGKRLAPYGIKVAELTGDTSMTQAQMNETHMIVVTPEKWDIVTRKTGEKTNLQQVKLIIIDEIHLLHDARGPVLEAIVARTIRHVEATQKRTRLVGLSATLPNYKDVARFLRVKEDQDPQLNGLLHFDATYRPVPLEQQYVGITERKPLKRRGVMNDVTYKKVIEVAGRQQEQCMIFVHSRKDTAATARMIRDRAQEEEMLGMLIRDDAGRKQRLAEMTASVKDEQLKALLPFGFGIHHAGLDRNDREIVEDLFRNRELQVLCCTATLAWGVNLPAYCVIIKGTQIYNPEKGSWVELSFLDIMQMIGRAGRFDSTRNQADQKGLGIVITGGDELPYYLSLLNQQLPIESHFITRLTDQLNAEIVMGTIHNREEAVRWLGYTYLFIRMLRKPELYRVSKAALKEDPKLEQRRLGLVHRAACDLEKAGLIRYDQRTGIFESTELGRVSSYYYLTIGTIQKFNEHLSPTMQEMDLFRLFTLADEFKYMSVRDEEKQELRQLIDRVPIPVKEDVENPLAKVNVLLQAYISQRKLDGFSIMSDMVYIRQSATRVLRAMFEIVLKRQWASLADKVLTMAKMVEHRMWLSQSPLRQFREVPRDIIQLLERKKEITWDRLLLQSPDDLEVLLRRGPKDAKRLFNFIHRVPCVVPEARAKPITRSLLRVELSLTPNFQFHAKYHGGGETFLVIVEDPDGERILHSESVTLRQQEEHLLYFYLQMFDPVPPQYFIKIVSDRWLWSESVVPLPFQRLILPERAMPQTELNDVTPHPISVVGEEYQALFPHYETLNAVQTQVFPALHGSDNNVLICAPGGSGKTFCAEVAMLRLFSQSQGAKARVVYVAPKSAIVDRVYKDWVARFKKIGKKVVQFTGDTNTDLQLLETGDIITASAAHWDQMSRKWTKRVNVRRVSLFIFDELHHLDTVEGPAYEIAISRARFLSKSQNGIASRIVGLSHSLLHAREMGSWLGAKEANIFNFHSAARPCPLELHFRTFEQSGYSSRTAAMLKPSFLAIKQHAEEKPVLIFAPSKRIAYQIVVELVQQLSGDSNPERFVHDRKAVEQCLEKVTNPTLKRALESGVAFLDRGMSPLDTKTATALFNLEAIQVAVCPYDLAYKVDLRAYMVIIAGTQYYDGKQFVHADYAISDMFEMLSKAGRQDQDDRSIGYIMCHAPKKEALKHILYAPYPVESMLEATFADHLNAEIANKQVKSRQQAVEYLVHTFLSTRLRQNPNFYGMTGNSREHLNEKTSQMVEDAVEMLREAGCVKVDDEDDEADDAEAELEGVNLGSVAAHYYLSHATMERFNTSVSAATDVKKLIEIIAGAAEFDEVVIRHREEEKLEKLARHSSIAQKDLVFSDPHTKVAVLLHAHLSRLYIDDELNEDLREILLRAMPMVAALADVITTNQMQRPLLNCLRLSQMLVQGMWNTDPQLLQLPYVSKGLARHWLQRDPPCAKVSDVQEMEDDERAALLEKFTPHQVAAIAEACNAYPGVEISCELLDAGEVYEGEQAVVKVRLERDLDEDEEVPLVHAPLFPQQRKDAWLVVLAEEGGKALAVRRIGLKHKGEVQLVFDAPAEGERTLVVYAVSESYIGADEKETIKVTVRPARDDDDEEEEEEEMEEGK